MCRNKTFNVGTVLLCLDFLFSPPGICSCFKILFMDEFPRTSSTSSLLGPCIVPPDSVAQIIRLSDVVGTALSAAQNVNREHLAPQPRAAGSGSALGGAETLGLPPGAGDRSCATPRNTTNIRYLPFAFKTKVAYIVRMLPTTPCAPAGTVQYRCCNPCSS